MAKNAQFHDLGVGMETAKPTLQWAERTLRALSIQKYTGTVMIRFSQGGVQGMAVNQELSPQQQGPIIDPQQGT
jgi:hypothetical protein